jgi:hypothetical protein
MERNFDICDFMMSLCIGIVCLLVLLLIGGIAG